jgi:hypothetical protein
MIQTRFFTAQVSERHPIKTGADNYTVYLPFKEKNSCRYESGVVLIEDNRKSCG